MTKQNRKIKFEELGIKGYSEAFAYQQKLMDDIIKIKTENRDLPAEEQALKIGRAHV